MRYTNSAYIAKHKKTSLKNLLGCSFIILGLIIIYVLTLAPIYSIQDNFKVCIGACKPYNNKVKSESEYIEELIAPYSSYKNLNNQKYIATFFYRKEGFEVAKTALKVAMKESGFRSEAYNLNRNGSIDLGCWQINSIHNVDNDIRLDCVKSTNWIYNNLYKKKGFTPWYASRSL